MRTAIVISALLSIACASDETASELDRGSTDRGEPESGNGTSVPDTTTTSTSTSISSTIDATSSGADSGSSSTVDATIDETTIDGTGADSSASSAGDTIAATTEGSSSSNSESGATTGEVGASGPSWYFSFVEPDIWTRVWTVSGLDGGGVFAVADVSNDAEFGGQTWPSGLYMLLLDQDAELTWYRNMQGTLIRTSATAPAGGFIAGGDVNSMTVFGEGEANETTVIANGNGDGFFAEYADDGTFLWVESLSNTAGSSVHHVATLSDDTVLVTGRFSGTHPITLNPGTPDEQILVGDDSSSHRFITRYDPMGGYLWGQVWFGCTIRGVVAMPDDGLILTGVFDEPMTAALGTAEEVTLIPWGGLDVFVARLGPNGEIDWIGQMGGGFATAAWDAAPTESGEGAYIVGNWAGTASFDPLNEGAVSLQSQDGDYDIFLARVDGDGSLEWITSDGGPAMDGGRGVATLASGDVVIGGMFRENAHFGGDSPNAVDLIAPGLPGHGDVFLARYTPSGEFVSVVHGTSWWRDRLDELEPAGDGVLAAIRYADENNAFDVPRQITFFPDMPEEATVDGMYRDALVAWIVPPE